MTCTIFGCTIFFHQSPTYITGTNFELRTAKNALDKAELILTFSKFGRIQDVEVVKGKGQETNYLECQSNDYHFTYFYIVSCCNIIDVEVASFQHWVF